MAAVGSCLPCWCVHSFVGHFKSRREREVELGARAMEFTNIYVKNLHVDVDEQPSPTRNVCACLIFSLLSRY